MWIEQIMHGEEDCGRDVFREDGDQSNLFKLIMSSLSSSTEVRGFVIHKQNAIRGQKQEK